MRLEVPSSIPSTTGEGYGLHDPVPFFQGLLVSPQGIGQAGQLMLPY